MKPKAHYGDYLIYPDGKIFSKKSNKFKSFHKNKKGFLETKIFHSLGIERALIHRLVAIYFLPNPKKKDFVIHKNGDKSDNKVENLLWVNTKDIVLGRLNGSIQVKNGLLVKNK